LTALEIAYLSSILGLQQMITLTFYSGQSLDKTLNGQKGDLREFFYPLMGYAQFTAISSINIPNHAAYKAIAKECYDQDYFVDVTPQMNASDGIGVLLYFMISLCVFVCVPIIVAILIQMSVFKKVRDMLPKWTIPVWMKKHGPTILDLCVSGIWTLIAIQNLRTTEEGRKLVLRMIGGGKGHLGEGQDFTWDYAQMLAILIWFPVLWKAFTIMSMCIFPCHGREMLTR
jgi:type IV secretory pathway VirB6-like protein